MIAEVTFNDVKVVFLPQNGTDMCTTQPQL